MAPNGASRRHVVKRALLRLLWVKVRTRDSLQGMHALAERIRAQWTAVSVPSRGERKSENVVGLNGNSTRVHIHTSANRPLGDGTKTPERKIRTKFRLVQQVCEQLSRVQSQLAEEPAANGETNDSVTSNVD